MSFSGKEYNIVSYGVDDNGVIDIKDFTDKLYKHKPRMVIVGASSYSQIIDYSLYYEAIQSYNEDLENNIKEDKDLSEDEIENLYEKTKCYYMVDMAHVAGLVAGGVHPNPCEYADVVTSTTHKTLKRTSWWNNLMEQWEFYQKNK